jgi:hypothetical protein
MMDDQNIPLPYDASFPIDPTLLPFDSAFLIDPTLLSYDPLSEHQTPKATDYFADELEIGMIMMRTRRRMLGDLPPGQIQGSECLPRNPPILISHQSFPLRQSLPLR